MNQSYEWQQQVRSNVMVYPHDPEENRDNPFAWDDVDDTPYEGEYHDPVQELNDNVAD